VVDGLGCAPVPSRTENPPVGNSILPFALASKGSVLVIRRAVLTESASGDCKALCPKVCRRYSPAYQSAVPNGSASQVPLSWSAR
jgi:hypothetical protein